MTLYLITVGLIFAIALTGISIDRLYRRFAARNPQLRPFRDSERGCGSCSAGSGCSGGSCER